MAVRGPIVSLFILAAVLYLLVLLNQPLIYIFALPVSLLISSFMVFVIASEIVWRLIPQNTKQPFEKKKKRFTTVVVGCLVFLVLGGEVMNIYFLPGKFHPLSLFGDALILLYTVFIGWNIFWAQKKTANGVASAVFFLSISLFALLGNSSVSSNTTDARQDLTSLPYISWSAPDSTVRETGVTIFKEEHAFRGLNLYASKASEQAILMNMSGDILHTWAIADVDMEAIFPLSIELCKNGDLLISAADKMLVKLDWHSNVRWRRDTRVHHDLVVAENGDILALARKDDLRLLRGFPIPILNDYIFVFSPDGEMKREISLFKVLKDRIPLGTFRVICRWIMKPKTIGRTIKSIRKHGFAFKQTTPLDIFHTNAIQIIDRDIDGLCKKGNLLLSFRDLDLIGILDLQTEELVWTWGYGNLSRQHQPRLLDNGNILIFDNGIGRDFSRIVELDPVAKKVVWTYETDPREEFFSARMGLSQRLPNGNTLITNSESGHVFEIRGDGDVVWEFYNPDKGKAGKTRGVIYRMWRITNPDEYSFPEKLEG